MKGLLENSQKLSAEREDKQNAHTMNMVNTLSNLVTMAITNGAAGAGTAGAGAGPGALVPVGGGAHAAGVDPGALVLAGGGAHAAGVGPGALVPVGGGAHAAGSMSPDMSEAAATGVEIARLQKRKHEISTPEFMADNYDNEGLAHEEAESERAKIQKKIDFQFGKLRGP